MDPLEPETTAGALDEAFYLSVVIPAYNEASRIERTLRETVSYLTNQRYSWELIVVNDGSADDTAGVVEAFLSDIPQARLLSYAKNAGKGKAVRTGITASSGSYVLFMDADNSTPISEIQKAWPIVVESGIDIAIGSRGLETSDIQRRQPLYRKLGSWVFKWFHRLTIGVRFIEDTQCGFKILRGDVARWLFSHMRIDGYMFDIEVLYLANRLGYSIREFPVAWENDPDSRLRLFYDTARMFKHLAAIRLRSLKPLREAQKLLVQGVNPIDG